MNTRRVKMLETARGWEMHDTYGNLLARFESAAEALKNIKAADRKRAEEASVATIIEWYTYTGIGKATVKVLTGGAE